MMIKRRQHVFAILQGLSLLMFLAVLSLRRAGAQDPPKPDAKARVTVYRYKQYMGKGLRPSIYCDDDDVARLQDGRYVVLALTPGSHTLRSNDKQSQIQMNLKPGQQSYVRIDLAVGMWKGHGRLTLVEPEQGMGELQKMKPIDKDMIKDQNLVAPDFQPTR